MKNRKHILFQAVFPVCLAVILCTSQSFAHRINIFALVEADQIRVECKFSKKSPAQNSPVTIQDKASGKQLALKNTDEQGIALFPVTAEMKSAPQGLIAHINAGEGHENDFEIEKSELDGASASSGTETAPAPAAAAASPSEPSTPAAPSVSAASSVQIPADSVAAMSRQDLEKLISTAVDRRVTPLRVMIASQVEKGPGITEILGGIGWILGIFGTAALCLSRRKKQ